MTLAQLKPELPEIVSRGITRLAIIGVTKQMAPPPLGLQLRFPAARWLLDPPPIEATVGSINKGEISWQTPIDKELIACAVWVPWETTMDELFQLGQRYGSPSKPCAYRLFLIFGAQDKANQHWRPPIPCKE